MTDLATRPPQAATQEAGATVRSAGSAMRGQLREYGMIACLFAIMIFFQIMTDGTLLRPLNLTNLVLQNSYIVVMALGMLLVIVAGHIDLSVGSIVAFVGALAAVLIVSVGVPWPIAAIICLGVGGLVGAIQGYWVAYLGIPSFIVTLAGMLVFRGLTLALLQGQSIGPFPPEFQKLSSGFIPDFGAIDGVRLTSILGGLAIAAVMVLLSIRRRRSQRAQGYEVEGFGMFLLKIAVPAALIIGFSWQLAIYRGLPNVLIIMCVLILFYSFVTNRTVIGRRIYALGGNVKAAKLSGINTEKLTFLAFVNMGVLAGLAGLIFAARLNTATPKAGVSFELDVIAACFIGGASASGGVGKVTGAVIGALIMGVMNNGMSILGIGIDYQQVIKGLVLLAAVTIDLHNRRSIS